MNPCARTACNFNDWRQRVTTVVSRTATRGKCRRCPWAQSCQKRSQTTDAKNDPVSEKPRLSALDLAQKIRDSATKKATQPPLSTQQKRVLDIKRFSTQLQNVHPNVLAKHLHRSVLYQDNDVVVINKPYGVPVRDDTGVTSISSVLPVLSKMMTGNKIKSDFNLLPCLRLEKEASGALLLAKRAEVVERLLDLQRNHQVEMTYWVITVGVPVPSVGIIDIPIIEREVTGPQPHYKMALSPLFKMNDSGDGLTKIRAHRQAHPAVTKYKVLDSSSGCSLVELQPCTGVKHQMRVHMAFGLTCPILGDHKYSHWNKLAPQKLPERVLKKLGLEQSKSRHLPLHLFARRLMLPGVNQANVSVSCPAPKYFTQTSNLLQLMLPFKEERH
ncbi:pseudouridylate synthase RPUSD4, mitochondrial-like [Takifugu flavidus]|uniref:Pseudouridylate synthase RPUSD4, mitochondrial n=1 Tax=Takifugu flavidus TaxID=433684 RepID=A0A5C6N8E0_9TELE|nr:pseudouridylate synthase RPUSD4, mitochondrial-like [Takifugu flavidus]TWW62080.1 Mitochondrial RNA pseudouridine synthase rpusd4 [Takifugu flavidus]